MPNTNSSYRLKDACTQFEYLRSKSRLSSPVWLVRRVPKAPCKVHCRYTPHQIANAHTWNICVKTSKPPWTRALPSFFFKSFSFTTNFLVLDIPVPHRPPSPPNLSELFGSCRSVRVHHAALMAVLRGRAPPWWQNTTTCWAFRAEQRPTSSSRMAE